MTGFCECGKCPPVDPGDPGSCPGKPPQPMVPTLDLLEYDEDYRISILAPIDRVFGVIWHHVKRWAPIVLGFFAVPLIATGESPALTFIMLALIAASVPLAVEYRKPIPIKYLGRCPRCDKNSVLEHAGIHFCDSIDCTWGFDVLTEDEPFVSSAWTTVRTDRKLPVEPPKHPNPSVRVVGMPIKLPGEAKRLQAASDRASREMKLLTEAYERSHPRPSGPNGSRE